MAGVLGIGALGQQALAAMRATAAQGGATILGLHPGTETVLPDARALGTLECTLHKKDLV